MILVPIFLILLVLLGTALLCSGAPHYGPDDPRSWD